MSTAPLHVNGIKSYSAFSHKAGIHSKAILAAPETYEILSPSDWGMKRCKYPLPLTEEERS